MADYPQKLSDRAWLHPIGYFWEGYMPLEKYFKGKGLKVMDALRKQYKDENIAKRVFYATANKKRNEAKEIDDYRRKVKC